MGGPSFHSTKTNLRMGSFVLVLEGLFSVSTKMVQLGGGKWKHFMELTHITVLIFINYQSKFFSHNFIY